MPTRRGRRWVPPAGDQSELDLRKAEPRASRGDAEVAAHRQFEPAAERRAVHRRDGRLLHVVDDGDHFHQPRRLRRLAEFRDVGACDKCTPCAGENDRLDACIVARRDDAVLDALPDGLAQRIHGRIVDGDDGDVAVATHADWIAQDASPEIFTSYSRLRCSVFGRASAQFRNAKRHSAR
jgi:hypothetical protein